MQENNNKQNKELEHLYKHSPSQRKRVNMKTEYNQTNRKPAQENRRNKTTESTIDKVSKGFNNFKRNAAKMKADKERQKQQQRKIQRENDKRQRIEQQRNRKELDAKRERDNKLKMAQEHRIRQEEIKKGQEEAYIRSQLDKRQKEIELARKKRNNRNTNVSKSEEIKARRENYERNKYLHQKQQEKVYKSNIRKQRAKEKELERQLREQEKLAKRKEKRRKSNQKKTERLDIFSIRAGIDMPLLILILVLVAIGLVMMFSASYANAYYIFDDSYKFIKSQLPMAIIGVILMIAISYIDYHHLKRIAVPMLVLSFVLLIAVLFMPAVNEVHRWIQLGSFSFQASEVTKFALILFFAYYIASHFNSMDTFKGGVLPFLLTLVPTIILLILEPHISCTVIVIILAAIMMFIGGVKLKWFTGALGVIAAAGLYLVLFTDKLTYANDRIAGWLNPLTYANSTQWQDTWQTRNSLYAIGSGGLFGLGLGNSRQKYMYLPEPQNDFVFAIVCEELGFIGAIIILLLFALLIWRGFAVAMRSQDKFGMILGIGIISQVGIQVVLNIAVVTNTIPNTGISLPFFSYGGTSLIMLLMQMGVILSISRTSNIQKI